MPANLVEISPKDWPKLRDLYVEHKVYASAYNTLQIFIDWHQKNANVDVKIFTLDEDWLKDGTFLAYTSNQIICNTLDTDLTCLICCLKSFAAGSVYVIGGFQEHVLPAIKAYIEAQPEDFIITPTIWYKIQKDKINKLDISLPPGLKIDHLKSEHAAFINSFWRHSWPTARKFVENMITYNESVGAFDAKGNLVGWCLVNPIGHVALLQVIDSYKRQGLGSILVRCLAQKLLKNNLEVLTSVVNENSISHTLFDKLGFEAVDNVFWAFRKISE